MFDPATKTFSVDRIRCINQGLGGSTEHSDKNRACLVSSGSLQPHQLLGATNSVPDSQGIWQVLDPPEILFYSCPAASTILNLPCSPCPKAPLCCTFHGLVVPHPDMGLGGLHSFGTVRLCNVGGPRGVPEQLLLLSPQIWLAPGL